MIWLILLFLLRDGLITAALARAPVASRLLHRYWQVSGRLQQKTAQCCCHKWMKSRCRIGIFRVRAGHVFDRQKMWKKWSRAPAFRFCLFQTRSEEHTFELQSRFD